MRFVFFALCLVLAGCRSAPPPKGEQPPVSVIEAPLLSFQRLPCFGRCPVYTVELFADGRVHFRGEANVREPGEHEWRLEAAELQAVVARLETSGFGAWKNAYERQDMTDAGTAVLTYRGKTITHYHGDNSAPPELTALEDELDQLLGTASSPEVLTQ